MPKDKAGIYSASYQPSNRDLFFAQLAIDMYGAWGLGSHDDATKYDWNKKVSVVTAKIKCPKLKRATKSLFRKGYFCDAEFSNRVCELAHRALEANLWKCFDNWATDMLNIPMNKAKYRRLMAMTGVRETKFLIECHSAFVKACKELEG